MVLVDESKDKYLRAAAQVENVRKWTQRDTLARAKENQRNLLRQLLEVFDPTYHEGVEVRFSDVDTPIVAEVVQPGYLYENELLRPAGVVVLKPID